MKIKIGLILTLLYLFTAVVFSAPPEDPLSSFLGVKWGISAKEFTTTFQFKDKLDKERGMPGFDLRFFKMGDGFGTLTFRFKTKDNSNLEFDEANFDKFFLYRVHVLMESTHFNSVLQFFTGIYGKPTNFKETAVQNKLGGTFKQIEADWISKKSGRKVHIQRFDETIEYGSGLLDELK
jgi:hypothetical protein